MHKFGIILEKKIITKMKMIKLNTNMKIEIYSLDHFTLLQVDKPNFPSKQELDHFGLH